MQSGTLPRFIGSHPPQLERHFNAVATPTAIQKPRHSGGQGSISGCLYRSDRTLITLAQRKGGYHGDHYPAVDPIQLHEQYHSELPILHGKSLYLGHYMPHFGHFLVEMLSAFWCFPTFQTFDHFVFHPFAFGKHIPAYIKSAFSAFGISESKVLIIDRAITIADVTIPERSVHFHQSANIVARRVYEHLRTIYAPTPSIRVNKYARRYYISRTRTSLGYGFRTVANELFIEGGLRQLGFVTIYPEQLSFPDQVRLFSNADIVCGIGGSGMHNALFMQQGALLIEIGDARTQLTFEPMQAICNELAGIDAHFVSFQGTVLSETKLLSWIDSKYAISSITNALNARGIVADRSQICAPRGANLNLRHNTLGTWLIVKSLLRLCKERATATHSPND